MNAFTRAEANESNYCTHDEQPEPSAINEKMVMLALQKQHQQQQAKDVRLAEKRRLNALHSRRKRDRRRIEYEVLHDQCANLIALNEDKRLDNFRLMQLTSKANEVIQLFHANPLEPFLRGTVTLPLIPGDIPIFQRSMLPNSVVASTWGGTSSGAIRYLSMWREHQKTPGSLHTRARNDLIPLPGASSCSSNLPAVTELGPAWFPRQIHSLGLRPAQQPTGACAAAAYHHRQVRPDTIAGALANYAFFALQRERHAESSCPTAVNGQLVARHMLRRQQQQQQQQDQMFMLPLPILGACAAPKSCTMTVTPVASSEKDDTTANVS
jgi:hypothetical protein